jgi:hypothetical protein
MALSFAALATLAAHASDLSGSGEPESCKTVRFSDVGWTDVTSTTALAAQVLHSLGYTPTITVLSVPVTFASLQNKEIDVFLGNWMPTQEADRSRYVADGSVVIVGPNLTGAKYTLAVPAYTYSEGLKDFSDIRRFGAKLNNTIYGIEPGNDGNRVVLDLIKQDQFVQRGQVEVLKLYLLLLAFRMLVAGRVPRQWFLAGVVFAMAGILKLTPLLPVACLTLYDGVLGLTQRSGRLARLRAVSLSAGVGTGLVLFALLLPAAVLGWNANMRHLGTWFSGVATKVIDVRTSDFGEDVRTVRNQSLDNAAYRFGNWIYGRFAGGPDDSIVDRPHPAMVRLPMDNALAGELIVIGRVVGLALLLLFVIRSARFDQPLGRAVIFGLACVATLVVCPVARGCYFALFLPAVVFTSMWLVQLGRPRMAVFLAIVPAASVWLHYLCLPDSGRIGLLGLATAAWFFGSCAILDKALSSRRIALASGRLRVEPSPSLAQSACAVVGQR